MKKVFYLYKNKLNFGQEKGLMKALYRLEEEAGRTMGLAQRGDEYRMDYIRIQTPDNVYEAILEPLKQ